MQIQYLGFQNKARGRDYLYRVIETNAEPREFRFSISNQAFVESRLPYQDAADLCYQKLQKTLDAASSDKVLPRHLTLSDEDFDAYRDKHRPARKRSW